MKSFNQQKRQLRRISNIGTNNHTSFGRRFFWSIKQTIMTDTGSLEIGVDMMSLLELAVIHDTFSLEKEWFQDKEEVAGM